MNTSSQLAIIVPVYNETEAVADVIQQLLKVRGDQPWEIIAVDDGSDAETGEALAPFSDCITVIRHNSNRGYGASLKSGIMHTRAVNVMFFDSDGQHQAFDIPALLEKLDDSEFVFGVRPKDEGVPAIRKPGKWILKRVCNFLASRKIPDINCGLRVGRRLLYMRMLDILPDGFSFSTTSLMYALNSRYSVEFVPVNCLARKGNSTVRIFRDGMKTIFLALRLMMLFDPMRAFALPAIMLLILGAGYQIQQIIYHGLHIVSGAVLAILGGVILFFMGLLGDQVASLRKELSSHHSLLLEDD